MIDRAPVPPVHGMLRILQAGLTNTPVDKAGYEATINAVTGGQETRASLRRVMVGQNPTRDEREAFRKTIEAARDFVTLTQDSSTITPERRTAAIATLNILLAAGAHQKAYDREAAQLVTRANPLLFSEDPHGGAAVALYTVATILQTQERMMQTM